MVQSPPHNIEGILLVDKAKGLSSHDVVARARRALKTRKVGHAGTLDPMATGLLVILVGRYTRLSNHLTADDKQYLAEVCFGRSTNTDDAEGETLEEGDASSVTEERVAEVLAAFLGEQDQIPPAFSAISIGGERSYKKARRGESVKIPPRRVVFHDLALEDFSDSVARIRVHASKGTYIRSLARDIGQALGVPAHLCGLRRTQSGAYALEGAIDCQAVQDPEMALAALARGRSAVLGMAFLSLDRPCTPGISGRRARGPGDSPPRGVEGSAWIWVGCPDPICPRRPAMSDAQELVLQELKDNVLTLTLNRPEAMNAMNRGLMAATHAALEDAAANRQIRAVIIAGAGGKSFCAGADLKERKGMTVEETRKFVRRIRGLMDLVESMPMPTIAAIEGYAFGGGCELALACDLRVLGKNAKIGLTECALGIIPGAGGTQRLPRLVGLSKAKELIFTAHRVPAEMAGDIGLADRVVEAGDALEAAHSLANEIAKNAPLAVEAAKAAVNGGYSMGIGEGELLEARCYEVTLFTEDRMEGLKAFAEKRKPEYQGR
jgi:tRNA pseudouridine(55) synthase